MHLFLGRAVDKPTPPPPVIEVSPGVMLQKQIDDLNGQISFWNKKIITHTKQAKIYKSQNKIDLARGEMEMKKNNEILVSDAMMNIRSLMQRQLSLTRSTMASSTIKALEASTIAINDRVKGLNMDSLDNTMDKTDALDNDIDDFMDALNGSIRNDHTSEIDNELANLSSDEDVEFNKIEYPSIQRTSNTTTPPQRQRNNNNNTTTSTSTMGVFTL